MRGDFLGFSFNGYHSKDLGIVRVSDGDRYSENLIPDFEDKTVEIVGNDGTYYYGNNYKEKHFNISAAFDHLTEVQFRNMRRVYSNRNLCPLIFDEWPYKVYDVKLASAPEIKYVCFEERKKVEDTTTNIITYDGTERIYKGEIDFDFIAYNPFAIAPFKALDDYGTEEQIKDWKESSRLRTSEQLNTYDKYTVTEDSKFIKVYNPGDLDSAFTMYIPFDGNTIEGFSFNLEGVDKAYFEFNTITKNVDDNLSTGVFINTKNHLIEGVLEVNGKFITTGYIYNQNFKSGTFFKIPSDSFLGSYDGVIIFSEGAPDTSDKIKIYYNYIYY